MTDSAVRSWIARCVCLALTAACFLTPGRAEPIRIMALGDSITVGYTDNRSGWFEPFAFGYRSGLYTRLTDAEYDFQFVGASGEPWNHETAPPPGSVVPPDLRDFDQDGNRGYGGAGVSTIAGGIGNWLAADDPDVILLMIGINNITAGSTGHPTTVENNLFNLVDAIVATKPDAHLIVAQITPYATYTDAIVQYNSYIRDTLVPFHTALGNNVTTVDQYQNLLTGGAIDPSLFSNGINHPTNVGYDRMAQTWFEGIEALGDLNGGGGEDPVGLVNGGFEVPIYADPHHDYAGGIAGSGWTPTGRAGIDRGNPYGGTVKNSTAFEGFQMGFIQGDEGNDYTPDPNAVSSLSQNVSGFAVGETYTLSFQAKGMVGYSGVNPFHVSLGGESITFDGEDLVTPDGLYRRYISDPISATAETMNLRFFDLGHVAGQKVSWIDDVEIVVGTIPITEINLIVNGGFEDPGYVDPHHDYAGGIDGSGWTRTGRAGIDRGNPYVTALNSVPAEGLQMGFIQGDAGNSFNPAPDGVSSLGQDVSGFEIGKSYVLSFQSQAIDPFLGANPLYVSIDGVNLAFDGEELVIPDTTYDLFVSDPFLASAETMSLLFYDQGDQPGGKLSWIDCVEIFQQALPEFIPGDANGDNIVDYKDASILGAHWLASEGVGWGEGDFNLDHVVNDKDAAILAAHWGDTADGASVPEPSTLVLLAGTLLALAVLRRK